MEQVREPEWIRRAWAEGIEGGIGSGTEMDFCPRLPDWLATGPVEQKTITATRRKQYGQTFCEL